MALRYMFTLAGVAAGSRGLKRSENPRLACAMDPTPEGSHLGWSAAIPAGSKSMTMSFRGFRLRSTPGYLLPSLRDEELSALVRHQSTILNPQFRSSDTLLIHPTLRQANQNARREPRHPDHVLPPRRGFPCRLYLVGFDAGTVFVADDAKDVGADAGSIRHVPRLRAITPQGS